MEFEFTFWRIMIMLLPAQYAKFVTSAIGVFILYLENYGLTWHLVPAAISIGAALGVAGVPNKPKGQ